MHQRPDQSILDKVARRLGEPASFAEGVPSSILTLAGEKYGNKTLDEDLTQPTGFDPQAAALFEAIVESAYLVANADGDFDDVERDAFKAVVVSACGGKVSEGQMTALLADLADLLEEDGIDKRMRMVAKTVQRPEHAREILRVAGLLAHVSAGVSEIERNILERLARELSVESSVVEDTLSEVAQALAD
jgi:tellurite resistance protein